MRHQITASSFVPRPRKAAAALACALLLAPAAARASFEDLPMSPRNAALANSNAADVTDLNGFLLNPAALGGVRRWELFANYNKLYNGLSDGSNVGRQVVAVGAPFRWGTLAAGINNFTGGPVYSEGDTFLGFGKPAAHNKIWWGVTLHSLSVKYGTDQYTQMNPVLKKTASKTAMGMDLGMIYFAKDHSWGLSILHANEPDMGIKYTSKVDRKIHLSYGFKPVKPLSLDAGLSKVGSDTRFRFGAEGHRARSRFSLRGGFDIGTRDYRNFSFGIGYKSKNLQFDYAMTLPLSGVASTLGNQQVGFTARWGSQKRRLPARYEEEESEEDQDLMKVEAKPAAPTAEEQDKAREALEEARKDLLAGRFREGLAKLKESNAAQISPADLEELKAIAGKAESVSAIYGSISVVDNRTRLIREAITGYMQGDGKRAVNSVTYAWQLNPADPNAGRLRALIIRAFPLDAYELKLLPGVKLTDQKLQEALEAIYAGKYIAAVSTCKEVLDLEPDNILAMIRMGSAYWAMGMEDQARKVWRTAQERDPSNDVLRKFLARPSGDQREAVARAVSPEVQDEFRAKLAYYERLKRSGADAKTLSVILKKILDQFEGTGVDLSQVYKDYEQVKGR